MTVSFTVVSHLMYVIFFLRKKHVRINNIYYE